MIKNQRKNSNAFVNKYDPNIIKELKRKNYKSKIIKVNTSISNKVLNIFQNNYFLSSSNKENLSFVLEISKVFKVKKKY